MSQISGSNAPEYGSAPGNQYGYQNQPEGPVTTGKPPRKRRRWIIGAIAAALLVGGIGNALINDDDGDRERDAAASSSISATEGATEGTAEGSAEATTTPAPAATTPEATPLEEFTAWVAETRDGAVALDGDRLSVTFPFGAGDVPAALDLAAGKASGILTTAANSGVEFATLHLAALAEDGSEAVAGDFARDAVQPGIPAEEVWARSTTGAPVYGDAVQAAVDAAAAAEAEAAAAAAAEAERQALLEFPGRQPSDTVGFVGDTLQVNGLDVTVTEFANRADYFDSYLCFYVSLASSGSTNQDYNEYWDWKLQSPAGQIVDPALTGLDGTLGSGELAPGGTAGGWVCFESGGEPGQYVALNEDELSWTGSDRGAWVTTR